VYRNPSTQPVRVFAVLPDGRISPGGWSYEVVRLRAIRPRPSQANAGPDGSAVFNLLCPVPSVIPVQFQFKLTARGFDTRRVQWTGSIDVTLGPRPLGQLLPEITAYVPVQRATFTAENFELEEAAIAALDQTELGKLVLYDIDEMVTALRQSLPSGTLALAGKVLDGTLKFKGSAAAWWPAELDEKPLRPVLQHPTVRSRIESEIGPAEWVRLTTSFLYLRNTGAHQKYTSVSHTDAAASVGMVLDIINGWVR
jgi:hypothetical protein